MFNVIKNKSPLLRRPRGKVFDTVTHKSVFEPDEIIDQRVDYRAMSIGSQIANGTLDSNLDFSNYGANPLDMADKIQSSIADFNEQLDVQDVTKKAQEEFDNMVKDLGFETNN